MSVCVILTLRWPNGVEMLQLFPRKNQVQLGVPAWKIYTKMSKPGRMFLLSGDYSLAKYAGTTVDYSYYLRGLFIEQILNQDFEKSTILLLIDRIQKRLQNPSMSFHNTELDLIILIMTELLICESLQEALDLNRRSNIEIEKCQREKETNG